jgi:hypothetical protein
MFNTSYILFFYPTSCKDKAMPWTEFQSKQLVDAVESSRDREGVIRWALVSENEFLANRSKYALQTQYRMLTRYTKEVARTCI